MDLFLQTYIDTSVDTGAVQSFLDQVRDSVFHNVRVHLGVSKNYDFDVSACAKRLYHFMFSSICFADASVVEEIPENLEQFQSGIVQLVNILRSKGWVVMVMCDFEEKIIEETGWNWTEDNPEPPGRDV